MTVVNASSSYCYSILLTVLRCHSLLPAHPLWWAPPTPPIHSLTREYKTSNDKNFKFRVGIHCPVWVAVSVLVHSRLMDFPQCSSQKQQNEQEMWVHSGGESTRT